MIVNDFATMEIDKYPQDMVRLNCYVCSTCATTAHIRFSSFCL